MTKRRLERERGRRETIADMSENLSEGEKGDVVTDVSTHGDNVRGRLPRINSVDAMETFISQQKGKKLYIVLISLHGLIRGENMELGRDSDTGGQISELPDFHLKSKHIRKVVVIAIMRYVLIYRCNNLYNFNTHNSISVHITRETQKHALPAYVHRDVCNTQKHGMPSFNTYMIKIRREISNHKEEKVRTYRGGGGEEREEIPCSELFTKESIFFPPFLHLLCFIW